MKITMCNIIGVTLFKFLYSLRLIFAGRDFNLIKEKCCATLNNITFNSLKI